MKLVLCSSGVGSASSTLLELVGSSHRAAVVVNALDLERSRNPNILADETRDLRTIGFKCEELDLRAYFADFDGLRTRLDRVDLVWVAGGNTFVLARAMTASRFGEAIADLIADGRIVYGGYSAGSCIVGPDLDACRLMDDAEALPDGYDPATPPLPLGWLPWRIVPHWRLDHDEAAGAERAATYLLEAGLPFQVLRDGQAYVVNGRHRYLV